jgi:nucleoside-diphosphate-sugar epimerase
MKASSFLLVSAPPASAAAAALAAFTNGGGKTAPPPSVIYLSSLSIYGDHGGAEVDESAALQPTSERGCERIAAEEAWKKFGRETGSPVAILRLAGIYGPRRNALVTIANGQTKRIVTPNQVFNRIHVDDITQIVHAAFAGRCNGVFNAADDEPAPQTDVVAYAAKLLRQPLPPEVPFEKAKPTMSAMAKSFYEENKRAINRKIKSEFGLTLRYPNYRTGLDALFAARDHEGISA